MIEVGRVCVKLSGRDAGKHCIIIDIIDDNYVMVDGLTRRRKCNVKHLEPLKTLVKIKKNAEHDEVISELKNLGISIPKEKKKFVKKKEEKVKKEKEEKKGRPKKEKKVGEKKKEKESVKQEERKKEKEKEEKKKRSEKK